MRREMRRKSMAKTEQLPRRPRRAISGVLVLDKPTGMTSNAALQRVKWLFRAEKAGHTGSLDPLATGVLPLCFGDATKFSQYLLDADKSYRTVACLGVATDSGDADGNIIAERPVPPLDRATLEAVLARFTGDIRQMPSMFSALKRDGRPLYELARAGITVPREARPVHVSRLALEAFDAQTLTLVADVSKGTYIRSLVEDIGQALGCGAHVTVLRRLAAGRLDLARAVTLAEVERIAAEAGEAGLDRLLLPSEITLEGWPVVILAQESAYYVRRGQPARADAVPEAGRVAIFEDIGDGQRLFLGAGEILDDGRVAPRRMVNTGAASN